MRGISRSPRIQIQQALIFVASYLDDRIADLELPNPEERQAKAQLMHRIVEIISDRNLTQVRAGEILGIDPSKVSKLVRGRLADV